MRLACVFRLHAVRPERAYSHIFICAATSGVKNEVDLCFVYKTSEWILSARQNDLSFLYTARGFLMIIFLSGVGIFICGALSESDFVTLVLATLEKGSEWLDL